MAAPMAKHAGFFRGHNFAHIRNFLSSTGRGKWQWLHLSSSSRVAASYGQRNGGDRPDIAGPGVDRSDSRGGAPCEDRGSGHGGRDAVSPGEGGSPGNAPPEDRVNRLRKSQLQAMRRNMRLKYGIDTENTLQNTLTDLQDDMPTHSDSVRTGNLTVGAGQSKATSRQRKSHSVSETAAEDDFFGILEEETDSLSQHTANQKGIGTKKSGLGKSALYEKFRFLDKYQNEDVEQVIEMPYGLIRRDQDNIPKKHGHIYARKGIFKDMEQESMKLKLVMTADSTQNENEADDRQNMTKDDTGKHASIRHNHKDRSDLTTPVTLDFHGSSYIEDQFFSYESLDGASSSGTKPGDRTDSRKLNEDTLKEPAISSGSEFPAGAPENHSNAFMDSIQSSTNSAGPKSVFSEQYLHIDKDNISEDLSHKSPEQRGVSLRASVDAESSKLKPESSLFDEQYFGINEQAMDMEEEFPHSLTSICDSPKTSVPDIENTMVTNPFEEQYFEKTLGDEISFSSDDSVETLVAPPFVDNRYADNEHVSQARSENVFEMYGQSAVDTEVNHSRQVSGEKVEDVDSFGDMVENLNTSTDVNHYIETVTKQQERLRNHPKPDLENPQSAYDVAMKIRLEQKGKLKSAQTVQHILPPNLAKWTGAVDSKGFRKLKDQVLDIQNLQEEVVIKILKNSIIYENDDIVALDKPYGLPSHGGPGVHHSVGKLCGKLGQILDKKLEVGSLKLVHRLDKETTGIMVLAKNDESHHRLRDMFKKRQVVKKYWVITKEVPNPTEGVIDIPMVETKVGSYYRMNLKPYKTEETMKMMKVQRFDSAEKVAVTNYRVLDSAHGSALVECHPETGVKHQIRCHLSFALNTPILGDHKYSHYSKMAPQRLPPEMLVRLGLRQATVRYIPMHLHAKMLVFPQLYDGKNVFISARLPKHFVQNMKWLKLKPPKGI